MFHTLLSPVDGSPSSENALPFALNIAAGNAKLHVGLVHVPATFGESSAAHWADFDAEARKDEEKYLGELRQRLSKVSRANVEIHHLEGIVPETLAEEVAERRVDLVVINAHGWGYISALGSGQRLGLSDAAPPGSAARRARIARRRLNCHGRSRFAGC